MCGRRRRRGGPLAAVPSPAARRVPAAAATAAQIKIVCENISIESICYSHYARKVDLGSRRPDKNKKRFFIFIFHFNLDFLLYFCHRWYYLAQRRQQRVRIGILATGIPAIFSTFLLNSGIFGKKFCKNFQFVRPSPPRRGPSGWRGSGRRLEGPRCGGDGRTN